MSQKARRFARNVGWSMAGQVAAGAASFFVLPFLVRRLGKADYGLYILMHTVASYLLLLTFGAGATMVKFVAEQHGEGGRGLRDALRCGFWAHAAVLPGAVLLFAGARPLASRIFHVPDDQLAQAVVVMRAAAAGAVFAALVQLASGVLQGLQRFDVNNVVIGLQNGLMPVGAAAAVALGLGLTGAASWYVLLTALSAAGALAAALALVRPELSHGSGPGLAPGAFSAYSVSMWLSLIAWVVTFQCDKIFLARGTSLADLTLYSVPANLVQRVQILGPLISNVLLPMLSELRGSDAEAATVRIYLKTSRFFLWLILPALVLLFILMPQFLGLWLGGDFAGRGVWPARCVVLASLSFLLTAIPNAVACSRGRPWAMTAAVWAQAGISVLAWKLLVPRLGILGVALGSLLAQALPMTGYLLWLHGGLLRLGEGRFLREAAAAPLTSAALLALLVYPAHSFVDSWPRLIAAVACGLLLYYGSAWLLLDADDKRLLKALVKKEPAPVLGV